MSLENTLALGNVSTATMMPADKESWYQSLMAWGEAGGNPIAEANQLFLAKMLASWACGEGALPMRLGLSAVDFSNLLKTYFPHSENDVLAAGSQAIYDPERLPEREDVMNLLLQYRAGIDVSEYWIAEIVVAACMGLDHLWQDLGLWSRQELSEMLLVNFPELARRNSRNMKWKKFIYKQLCERDDTFVCRAPSCDVCADYQKCFGPEE